ncbi:hypothetical protein BDQ12DRAFT_721729 [Crucibulum laeve]|uniref:Uncharacterized protein n=1 Tax=Crucibulum laeve TaxID=68775 RepID=A0A5C3MGI9_9AGAR|nr:hypothetical protein BDQ12DRAFT_721729 [Crucibulum laeve]
MVAQSTHQRGFNIDVGPAAMNVVNSTRYSLHADEEWASLTPRGHGFVRHPDKEEYFSVSLYHQIHCLNALRNLIIVAQDHNLTWLEVGHANHCLNYLRQMTLCNADTTLEPTTPKRATNGKIVNAVTGIGITHRCRDWSQVRQKVEENYDGWKKAPIAESV